jgi:hypothetical protein
MPSPFALGQSSILTAQLPFTLRDRNNVARYEVLGVVLLQVRIFWDMTLRLWASTSRRFEGSQFHIIGLLDPEDEGTTILQKHRDLRAQ